MNGNAPDVQGATISRRSPPKRLDTALHARDRQERFLAAFAECGSVLLAARWARVHRQSHYFWMKEDPTYPARFEEARKQATRALEDAAIRRAKEGTAKPVLHKGKQVYVDGEPLYEHQYSDALLMFLLRAYDREKFGDRQVIELKLEDWDGDLSKLSEQSAKRLLGQIEAKISPAGGLCAKSAQAERTLAELWPASGSRSSRQLALLLA